MKNDELKALYEEFPWAWVPEFKGLETGQAWWKCKPRKHEIGDADFFEYRLKPRLPADLSEPTEDMMNRAVYIGRNADKIDTGGGTCATFEGWYLTAESEWRHGPFTCVKNTPFCIDINDPNAREIIALNRARAEKPFDVEVETHPVAEMVQSVFNERIQYLLAVNEQSIRDALIELGWTPPGESAWLRLDECEIEVLNKVGFWRKPDRELTREHIGTRIIQDGPASVRVRKKRSNQ